MSLYIKEFTLRLRVQEKLMVIAIQGRGERKGLLGIGSKRCRVSGKEASLLEVYESGWWQDRELGTQGAS